MNEEKNNGIFDYVLPDPNRFFNLNTKKFLFFC